MKCWEIYHKSVTWMILAYDTDQWQTYKPGCEMKEIFLLAK